MDRNVVCNVFRLHVETQEIQGWGPPLRTSNPKMQLDMGYHQFLIRLNVSTCVHVDVINNAPIRAVHEEVVDLLLSVPIAREKRQLVTGPMSELRVGTDKDRQCK